MIARISGRWSTIALVVGAATLVALASGGTGFRFSPLRLGEDAVRLTRLGGLLAILMGGAGLLALRDRGAPKRNDPTLSSILATAGLMTVLAAASLLVPPLVTRPSPATESEASPPRATVDPEASGPPPPPSRTAPITEGRGLGVNAPEPAWGEPGRGGSEGGGSGPLGGPPPRGSPVLLGLLLAVAAWMALRARRGGGPREEIELPDLPEPWVPPGHPGPTSEPAADGPPGSQDEVVRAYHRLLDALAGLGLGRRPHEAPYEHLHRVAGESGADPGPMYRLASLYVRTLFGPSLPSDRERAGSREALARSLTGLRDADGPGGRA